jgi:hypothetical protein
MSTKTWTWHTTSNGITTRPIASVRKRTIFARIVTKSPVLSVPRQAHVAIRKRRTKYFEGKRNGPWIS